MMRWIRRMVSMRKMFTKMFTKMFNLTTSQLQSK